MEVTNERASSSGITSDEVTYKEPCILLVTCFSTSKMHDYSHDKKLTRHRRLLRMLPHERVRRLSQVCPKCPPQQAFLKG